MGEQAARISSPSVAERLTRLSELLQATRDGGRCRQKLHLSVASVVALWWCSEQKLRSRFLNYVNVVSNQEVEAVVVVVLWWQGSL